MDPTYVQLDAFSQTGHLYITSTQIKKGCAQPPQTPPGPPHGSHRPDSIQVVLFA